MSIILSLASWLELWDDSWQHTRNLDPLDNSDAIAEYPAQLAKGYKRNISLRNGIDLTLHRYTFHEDVITYQLTE